MILPIVRTRVFAFAATSARLGILIFLSALVLSQAAFARNAAMSQQAAPAAVPDSQPAPAPAQPPAAAPSGAAQQTAPGEITEEELRRLLVGKVLFLRGGYLDNTLSFNKHGLLIGRSPQGSYTLNGIQINKVRLTKHKVELDAATCIRVWLAASNSIP